MACAFARRALTSNAFFASWGASWGEAGYARLARGDAYGTAGMCGVLQYPARPI